MQSNFFKAIKNECFLHRDNQKKIMGLNHRNVPSLLLPSPLFSSRVFSSLLFFLSFVLLFPSLLLSLLILPEENTNSPLFASLFVSSPLVISLHFTYLVLISFFFFSLLSAFLLLSFFSSSLLCAPCCSFLIFFGFLF